MSTGLQGFLKNKAINEWGLFWLITAPISIAMLIAMAGADLRSGPGVSSMIQVSVRCAVPWLYLAFAASSMQILFPGPFSLWWSRNRKYFGLCFAAAMAWQGLFIVWMTTVFNDYYVNEVYLLRDAIEGTIGYAFLFLMTVTSFVAFRKRLQPKTWKLLHKSGIYFLWAYAFSVYWWNLFYYGNPMWLDYVYYWGGFMACALRIAAWRKKRLIKMQKVAPEASAATALKIAGGLFVALGLFVASFGLLWQETTTEFLTAPDFSASLVLWLPYWPFEPFLPLFIIALGAYLTTKVRA